MTTHKNETCPTAVYNETIGREVFCGSVMDANGEEIKMRSWLGSAPEFDHVDEELAADVVVCGGGIAGVCAARAAVEAGARVVLLERCATVQGRSCDFAVIGSENVRNWWGIDTSPYKDRMLKSFMRDTGWRSDYRAMKYWIDHCGETFDWYIKGVPEVYIQQNTLDPIPEGVRFWIGPKCRPLPEKWDADSKNEYYTTWPVTLQFNPSHVPALRAGYELALATGKLTARFNTRAQSLIRGEDGSIAGVYATGVEDGRVLRVNAKAVILATGDIKSNPDMVYYYMPWAKNNPIAFPGRDRSGELIYVGDGHRMALWAGGKIEDGPHGMMNHNMGGALGVSPFMLINAKGLRFINEDITGQEWDNALMRQPKHYGYQIFDANWTEQVESFGPSHGAICGLLPEGAKIGGMSGHFTNRSQLEKAVESGRCIKADSLDELIAMLELDDAAKARALSEVARYNSFAKNGEDKDFGKRADRLFPIENGPFYASKVTLAPVLAVLVGIDCDHELNCYDSEMETIPGLYCAGNCQGNRFPTEYPMTIPGLSHSIAMTHGRHAGINAADYALSK